MGKQIFLLNGPSSSGKSTLAKELQKLISENRILRDHAQKDCLRNHENKRKE